MLTKEENDLLTQTGPGTPCGRLLRSYWQPAALSEELPPGGAPIPVRLLGEDLVMFRDGGGQPRRPACNKGPADRVCKRPEQQTDGGRRADIEWKR